MIDVHHKALRDNMHMLVQHKGLTIKDATQEMTDCGIYVPQSIIRNAQMEESRKIVCHKNHY